MQNTITAYVNGSTHGVDGSYSCSFTRKVECKISLLPWQDMGLSYTASGYGSRIPTRYMVQFSGKWRRVYCRIYSNIGTLYIGRLNDAGERLIINIYN